MKKTIIGVAFVVSVLVLGCQDSNFNNPVSTNSSNRSPMSKAYEVPSSFISLNQLVQRGVSADILEQFQITGQVQYTLTAADEQNVSSFSATLKSEIFSLNNEKTIGAISGESSQSVVISPEKPFEITRSYEVREFDQPLRLFVTFSLTTGKVEVAKIWVEDDMRVGIHSVK